MIPGTHTEALAIAERLTEADAQLRVLTRAGLLPAPAELNAACAAVMRLAQSLERVQVRLQIEGN